MRLTDTENELKLSRRLLTELRHAKQSDLLEITSFDTLDPALALQDDIRMLILHEQISRICDANRRRATEMHNRCRIVPPVVAHRVHHTIHHPLVIANIESALVFLDPIVRVVFSWRSLADQATRQLIEQYIERRALWEALSRALERYNRESRELLDQWPAEMFNVHPYKNKDGDFRAPDQPMYTDEIEFHCYAFYSTNGFVPDPVRAHNEYKQRLVWTPAEKQIFLDKYRLHPREFKKIAAGLPQKSVKDVIEYYYIHRIDLDLKRLEQQSKKRGRKIIITEGAVRK
jgi:hypothetical protein